MTFKEEIRLELMKIPYRFISINDVEFLFSYIENLKERVNELEEEVSDKCKFEEEDKKWRRVEKLRGY